MRLSVVVMLFALPLTFLHLGNEYPLYTFQIDKTSSLLQSWNSCSHNDVAITLFTVTIDPCTCWLNRWGATGSRGVPCPQTYNLWSYENASWPRAFHHMQFCLRAAVCFLCAGWCCNVVGFAGISIDDLKDSEDEETLDDDFFAIHWFHLDESSPRCTCAVTWWVDSLASIYAGAMFYALSWGFALSGPWYWLEEEAVAGSVHHGLGAYFYMAAGIVLLAYALAQDSFSTSDANHDAAASTAVHPKGGATAVDAGVGPCY